MAAVIPRLELHGGEVFVPKIPSMKIIDLAKAIAPECRIELVGIRPGEKLHEVMVPEDDARNTLEYDNYFAILPAFHDWDSEGYYSKNGGSKCPDGFKYSSDNNSWWLTIDEVRKMLSIETEEKVA